VTAGPDRQVDRPPAWFVTTEQGVILAGPYLTRAEAEWAHAEVVNHLETELARAGRPGRFIARRIAAVRVSFGLRSWPHGRFEPR
jgi:hypothetical protein